MGGAFSDYNVNKTVSVILVTVAILAMVAAGIFGFQLPAAFDTIIGIILGFVTHSLGVISGTAAINGSSANAYAASAAASAKASEVATVNAINAAYITTAATKATSDADIARAERGPQVPITPTT